MQTTNTANTITVAPEADFHLFISAGASIYFWIASALFVALVVWIWMLHNQRGAAAEPEEKEAKK